MTAWAPYRRPCPSARLRLFCFPHAGGGASTYRGWASELSPSIEVCAIQGPGRENRVHEEPYTNLDQLTADLGEALDPLLDRPFALFGHSLGSLVAFEFARVVRQRHGLEPARLFVSSYRAPHLPNRIGPFSHLPEPEFVAAIRELGTTPDEVFENAELCAIVLPALRADFTLSERYVLRDRSRLDCPISAFGGTEDSLVSYEELAAWREHTNRSFTLRTFRGDHFFLETAREQVYHAIRQDLARVEPPDDRQRGPPEPRGNERAGQPVSEPTASTIHRREDR